MSELFWGALPETAGTNLKQLDTVERSRMPVLSPSALVVGDSGIGLYHKKGKNTVFRGPHVDIVNGVWNSCNHYLDLKVSTNPGAIPLQLAQTVRHHMVPPPPGTPAGNGGKYKLVVVYCFLNGVLKETPDGSSVYSGEPEGLKNQMGQLFDSLLFQIQWGVRVFLVLGGSGALFNIEGGWDHLVDFYLQAARNRGIPTINGVRYYSTAVFHSSFHLKRCEQTQQMFSQMFLDIDSVAHVFYPNDRDRLLLARSAVSYTHLTLPTILLV